MLNNANKTKVEEQWKQQSWSPATPAKKDKKRFKTLGETQDNFVFNFVRTSKNTKKKQYFPRASWITPLHSQPKIF